MMSNRTLNPEPSFGAVTTAQARMVTLLQKRDLMVLAAIVLVMVGLALWGQARMDSENGGSGTIPLFRGLSVPLALLGLFWPLSVWRADSPERRGYFWSLPVDRRRHTSLRVAVGWVGLVGVSLLIMAAAAASFIPSLIRFEGATMDVAHVWEPLATATLGYVIVSIFAVLFESPIRGMILGWGVVLGLFIVGEAADLDWLVEAVEDTVGSLFVAIGGPAVADESVSDWGRQYLIWLPIAAVGLASALLWRHEER
jgi:hypothetical protein